MMSLTIYGIKDGAIRRNSAGTTITYDGTARPTQSTSKLGAQTTYTYSISPPWTMATINGRWTKTWTDSFGRTIKVETGNGAPSNLVTKSIQETKYGACGCNPLGKVSSVSRPYAPGATPVWTTYQYDTRGRTTSVTLPDGSATTYSYSGYSTTITDAAGKWKTQVVDALGNLVQLIEPDPAGGANLVTNYTYDHFDRLVQVSMPRGSTTQTRTWTYDPTTLRLSSISNPESETTTYTWNTDGSLQKRTDARGMSVNFVYDSYGRVTAKTPKFANGTVDGPSSVVYYYDSYTDSYVQNAWGRLAATKNGGNGGVVEMYSYNNSGTVSAKRLLLYSPYRTYNNWYIMEMTYTYL